MREINHNARLKGVNQKFEPSQSETFVCGRTKVFKKAGSVRKRFLSPSSPPPYFSFLPSPYFSRGQKPENNLLARWKRLPRMQASEKATVCTLARTLITS